MFCILRNKHATQNLQNKSKTYSSEPATRFRKLALEEHAASKQIIELCSYNISRSLVFKRQDEANWIGRGELANWIQFASSCRLKTRLLSQKIHKTIQPVFVSQKINQHLKLREAKPPLVNRQSIVYEFKCDLCDAGYVGFTRRHLHQRVDEHRHTSSIGKHFRDKHSSTPKDLTTNFTILKKCNSKFYCLIYKMFLLTN